MHPCTRSNSIACFFFSFLLTKCSSFKVIETEHAQSVSWRDMDLFLIWSHKLIGMVLNFSVRTFLADCNLVSKMLRRASKLIFRALAFVRASSKGADSGNVNFGVIVLRWKFDPDEIDWYRILLFHFSTNQLCLPSSFCRHIRAFKKLRRQLPRKRHIKIELCVKLSLLRLFHVHRVVENRRIALSLAWHEWLSRKGKEWKIYCCELALWSEAQIRKFQVVVWQTTSKHCSKKRAARAARLFSFIQPIKSLICGVVVILPSSNLKLPIRDGPAPLLTQYWDKWRFALPKLWRLIMVNIW